MFITRETDYAIRMIRALEGGERISVKQICAVESIPVDFAYKILKKLNKAGFLEIARGAAGGCKIAKSLDEITLLDIVMAMNDAIALNECIEVGYECVNDPKSKKCNVRKELCRIQKVLVDELSSKSMTEVLNS